MSASVGKLHALFVTSRSEPDIHDVLGAPSGKMLAVNINAEAQTNGDIRRFVETRSKELKLALSNDNVALPVRRASELFIWCAPVSDISARGKTRKPIFKGLLLEIRQRNLQFTVYMTRS